MGKWLPLPQQEHALLAEDVGELVGPQVVLGALGVDRERALDLDVQRPAEIDEVQDGAEVDVGRVVPLGRDGLGLRHASGPEQAPAHAPMAEIRADDDRLARAPHQVLDHALGVAGRLECLRQDHIVEGLVGILGEIGIGIALHHREALRHAGIDARLAELDAAAIDLLEMAEIVQEDAVAATDIENAAVGLDHVGDQLQIDADPALGHARAPAQAGIERGVGRAHRKPRCSAQPSRKPRITAKNSGSSSRKASWPLSLSISTKLTLAAQALSACTMARLSEVGNSQSLVKETTQNRVFVPLNAFESSPPRSAA